MAWVIAVVQVQPLAQALPYAMEKTAKKIQTNNLERKKRRVRVQRNEKKEKEREGGGGGGGGFGMEMF